MYFAHFSLVNRKKWKEDSIDAIACIYSNNPLNISYLKFQRVSIFKINLYFGMFGKFCIWNTCLLLSN